MTLFFSIRTIIDCLPKSNLSIGAFSVEEKNDIVVPIFKTKNSLINKEEFIPLPAAKL